MPASSTTTLTLDSLIVLQQSEGCWQLDDVLAQLLQKSENELSKAIPNKIGSFISDPKLKRIFYFIFYSLIICFIIITIITIIISLTKYEEKLWATAIALAIIETNFMAMQEKWNLLSMKAYKWIQSVLSTPTFNVPIDVTSDDWVSAAKLFISS